MTVRMSRKLIGVQSPGQFRLSVRRDVVYVVALDPEAVLAQMLDPFPAATAGRALENLDGDGGLSQR